MDLIALVFILVIAILFIIILVMRRRNRQARKQDRYVYTPSNIGNGSMYDLINQVKEEELKERSADRKTASPDSAASQRNAGMKSVNVGRRYGYNEDIFWDEEEYDRFNAECLENGNIPQEAFAAKMRLAGNVTKIKTLLDEMIEIEKSYDRSEPENVSRLELIRSVIGRMYE